MTVKPYVFVSYARSDRDPVRRITAALNKIGVDTWVDANQLVAGESWQHSISNALRDASAILFFISPASMSSEWISAEFQRAVELGLRILPILLRPTPFESMPEQLRRIQWLDVSQYPSELAVAEEISRVLRQLINTSSTNDISTLADQQREQLAQALTVQATGASDKPNVEAPLTSIFIVHGHDDSFLDHVKQFIVDQGIDPIVMKDIDGPSVSLIQKFFDVGGAARFAIVLLSADDLGASRIQYENPRGGDRALKYRSRQNVILELGYFYGLLGWDKVFVLEKAAPDAFPDFERPSDLNGVVFDRFDESGKWKILIRKRLVNSGFHLRKAQERV